MTHLGVLALLTGVEKNENSALLTLHVLSVHVLQSVVEKYTELRELHPRFRLVHGRVIDDDAPLGESVNSLRHNCVIDEIVFINTNQRS